MRGVRERPGLAGGEVAAMESAEEDEDPITGAVWSAGDPSSLITCSLPVAFPIFCEIYRRPQIPASTGSIINLISLGDNQKKISSHFIVKI